MTVYMDSKPTSVYRYYDVDGLLIYVGITNQGISRNRQHNADKDWWPYVARQEVDHHLSRSAALAAEKSLIQKHLPPFNTVHNPHAAALRSTYLGLAGRADDSLTPAGVITRHGRRMPLQRIGVLDGLVVFTSTADCAPVIRLLDLDSLAGQSLAGRNDKTFRTFSRSHGMLILSVREKDFAGFYTGTLSVKETKAKGGAATYLGRGVELHSRIYRTTDLPGPAAHV